MFSYTGLRAPQVDHLAQKWHVYMTRDGRVSMAGVSKARAQYLADAMADAVRSCA
jgi:aspartate/tyrosine/aromatic aminotransferase